MNCQIYLINFVSDIVIWFNLEPKSTRDLDLHPHFHCLHDRASLLVALTVQPGLDG